MYSGQDLILFISCTRTLIQAAKILHEISKTTFLIMSIIWLNIDNLVQNGHRIADTDRRRKAIAVPRKGKSEIIPWLGQSTQ